MIVSFQRNEIHELCIALGSFLHYVILVSFIWLVFRPVVLLFSQVRRSIYEKDCFILPFFFMSWSKYKYITNMTCQFLVSTAYSASCS